MTDDRRQKTENRRQKLARHQFGGTGDRTQKTEYRRQETENRNTANREIWAFWAK